MKKCVTANIQPLFYRPIHERQGFSHFSPVTDTGGFVMADMDREASLFGQF